MLFFVIASVLSWVIDLATLRWRPDRAKDLEILLLRRQLAILQHAQPRPPRLTRWEKLGLAVLMSKVRALLSVDGRKCTEAARHCVIDVGGDGRGARTWS
jgi:hypothetical protein